MRTEVEDAVERLTEVMNDAIADHEDDVARAWEDGERPDLWDAPDVTVSIPDLRRVLAALRAQAERVRVLEGERDEARRVVCETLWMARRYADGRQTYAVGMFNDAAKIAIAGGYASGEPDGTMFAQDGHMPEYRSIQARAEAAERRAGELEGALRKIAFPPKGSSGPSLAGCIEIAARALLPATQAEGEK